MCDFSVSMSVFGVGGELGGCQECFHSTKTYVAV